MIEKKRQTIWIHPGETDNEIKSLLIIVNPSVQLREGVKYINAERDVLVSFTEEEKL